MTVLKPRIREQKSPRDVLCPRVYAQRRMGGSVLATSVNKLLLYGSLLQDPEYPLGELLKIMFQFRSVQLLSHVWLFATPWTAACQASLSITNSRSPLRFTSIESVMPSSHLILCRPLLPLPSIFPSIRVFSSESPLHIRWPVLEFQLQHQSLQWTPRTDLLWDWLVGSPCNPRDSQESFVFDINLF